MVNGKVIDFLWMHTPYSQKVNNKLKVIYYNIKKGKIALKITWLKYIHLKTYCKKECCARKCMLCDQIWDRNMYMSVYINPYQRWQESEGNLQKIKSEEKAQIQKDELI